MVEGFKNTEVGVIPNDWDSVPLSSVLKIRHGRSQKEVIEENGNYPILASGGQIGKANKYLYDKPSVLIGRKGTIDKPQFMDVPFWTVDTLFYSEIVDNCLPKFIYYQFLLIDWYAYNEASGVPSLNAKTIEKIQIPLPPTKAEQTAIATALSDADALISSLEKLIAKKKAIKQGAMQELLKPKESWIENTLGEVATLKARIGWQGLTTAEYRKTGNFYLITGTEFKNGFIDWDRCNYVDENRYIQDRNIQVKTHDILVTKDGTIGKVALIKLVPKPATLNSGVFVIRPIKDSFDPEFFYYLLLSNGFQIFLSQLSAGSTIIHLYQKDFVTFKFYTPKSLDEQKKIAKVLSDMDIEILRLEDKLEKQKQFKQGMMQSLLTGKIRLV